MVLPEPALIGLTLLSFLVFLQDLPRSASAETLWQ